MCGVCVCVRGQSNIRQAGKKGVLLVKVWMQRACAVHANLFCPVSKCHVLHAMLSNFAGVVCDAISFSHLQPMSTYSLCSQRVEPSCLFNTHYQNEILFFTLIYVPTW